MGRDVPEDLFERACNDLADIVVKCGEAGADVPLTWVVSTAKDALFHLEGSAAARRLAIRGEHRPD